MTAKTITSDIDFPELDSHRAKEKPTARHILHLHTSKNTRGQLTTTASVQELDDQGAYETRGFIMFQDFRRELANEPMARWNAKKAQAFHDTLTSNPLTIDHCKQLAIWHYSPETEATGN